MYAFSITPGLPTKAPQGLTCAFTGARINPREMIRGVKVQSPIRDVIDVGYAPVKVLTTLLSHSRPLPTSHLDWALPYCPKRYVLEDNLTDIVSEAPGVVVGIECLCRDRTTTRINVRRYPGGTAMWSLPRGLFNTSVAYQRLEEQALGVRLVARFPVWFADYITGLDLGSSLSDIQVVRALYQEVHALVPSPIATTIGSPLHHIAPWTPPGWTVVRVPRP